MKYLSEKDLLVQQIETIVCRETSLASFNESSLQHVNDPEVARLLHARRVLLGDVVNETSTETASAGTDLVPNETMVSEFQRVWAFLEALKGEKDHGKAILGLIECMLFLLKIVTSLSCLAAQRNNQCR